MKNKIKSYFSIALLAVSVSACNKQLDIIPEGSPSKQNFWHTKEDALKGVNAMYVNFGEGEFYGRGFMWFINASDDMVTGRSNGQADNIRNFSSAYVSGSYTRDQWSMRYETIKRANDVIRYVADIEMDQQLKNRYIGEAYFLSGLMNFQLASNYGNDKMGVPIVNRENADDPNPTPRAANVTLNYEHIESELKEAATRLPFFSSLSKDDYGRPHKVAAWSYLAKVYLYKKDYANAELYADSVIQHGDRELLPVFKDVFKAANNWSSEYIWSALSTPTGEGGWGSILPGAMLENKGWGLYNGWGYFTPTKELYDSYEAGDARLEATILKPGDQFPFFGELRTFSSTNSLSGYQFNKYMEPFGYANPIGTHISPNGDNPTSDLNVPLFRYAEILLIKAESELMQGKSADIELNIIRKRAGLAPVAGATMVELKKQRRSEFAGEWADRHRDLVRWGDAQEAYAKPVHGVNGEVIWEGRKFNPNVHDIWAVPQKEIDNSAGVIVQSSGW